MKLTTILKSLLFAPLVLFISAVLFVSPWESTEQHKVDRDRDRQTAEQFENANPETLEQKRIREDFERRQDEARMLHSVKKLTESDPYGSTK